MNDERDDGSLRQAVRRKGSFLRTLRSVAWAFFGVRKSSEYERDVQQLNPIHLIIAGLLAAAVFIGVLIMIVRWVVGSAAAA
jgi:hypothetical protein